MFKFKNTKSSEVQTHITVTPKNILQSASSKTSSQMYILLGSLSYRSLSAITAQVKIFHLELIHRLSSKIQQLPPTIPAHFLVEIYPTRCHYCKRLLYF